ncbi:WD40 repeat domain-containing protein [Dictyobacter arantiisoli]|uniref:Uncharacterized protein n=1 Tax=Dictyobacter arantiisoli TaxID=2014874 RepID=A0A5A5TJK6_9CHLR|nr:WD40 repeat domain-containing protein [Dictyobacter arantiisoli]GCF11203.1 hypothetical protein KDI_47670 [Dictyobacter arantiisoli]
MDTRDSSVTFLEFVPAIVRVVWSPDGKYIACGAVNGSVYLFGPEIDVPLAVWKPEGLIGFGNLSFSPDSRFLKVVSSLAIGIWDLVTHERVFSYENANEDGEVIQEPSEPIENTDWSTHTWSPHGEYFAVFRCDPEHDQFSKDTTYEPVIYVQQNNRRLWNLGLIHIFATQTHQVYRTLALMDNSRPGIYCLSWSPDAEMLAIGHYQRVHLWQPRTNQVLATYESRIYNGPKHRWGWGTDDVFSDMLDLYWSPDSAFLACVGYIGIEIWEVASGKKLTTYYGHNSGIMDVKWVMDKAAIVSVDREDIHFWHFQDGSLIEKVSIPPVNGVGTYVLFNAALSPDLLSLACVGYEVEESSRNAKKGLAWIWQPHINGIETEHGYLI